MLKEVQAIIKQNSDTQPQAVIISMVARYLSNKKGMRYHIAEMFAESQIKEYKGLKTC
jgi:hypothetical protein